MARTYRYAAQREEHMRDIATVELVRVFALALLGAAGCTTIQVEPLDPALAVEHICIQENPAVQVADFVDVIRARMAYHQVTTEVFSGPAGREAPDPLRSQAPDGCQYILTYTALRSWDITAFLSHAEIYLSHDGRQVAKGVFHLRGKGGYALTKFNTTKQKMDPVVDQLLGESQR